MKFSTISLVRSPSVCTNLNQQIRDRRRFPGWEYEGKKKYKTLDVEVFFPGNV